MCVLIRIYLPTDETAVALFVLATTRQATRKDLLLRGTDLYICKHTL